MSYAHYLPPSKCPNPEARSLGDNRPYTERDLDREVGTSLVGTRCHAGREGCRERIAARLCSLLYSKPTGASYTVKTY
jgi:hypothetical protein